MSPESLSDFYRGDIACLNRQGRESLGAFVHARAEHNGRPLGLAGYRALLAADFRAIPDLRFTIALLVSEPPRIASRLAFDGTPAGVLFGLPVNGRRVRFAENVFHELEEGRILRVWSLIDTGAIRAQL
ncbi:ester cyclase [Rhodobacteraceae bacterium DSL-40]|uniref:ester cyclase n=1 Tax=Amaricoccus sp. B4 TaxID=3368557 RepID=UPI000DAEA960